MEKEDKFVTVNGTKLRYSLNGKGEPAVVFVHAGIADSRMWDDQIAAFSGHFKVLTYDLRGFGLSPLVPGEYSNHEDLLALLKAVGIDRCILVGCSMGGSVIIDAALAAPSKVAALVVVTSAPHGIKLEGESEPPQWKELVKAFEDGDLERTNELEVQIWVDGYKQPVGRADESIREKIREMNAIALQNEVDVPDAKHIPLEPKAADRLEELTMPILFITGALDDPDFGRTAELIVPQLSRAKHIVMPDVAHLPNMESPETFNHHVLAFIDQVLDT